MNVRRVGRSGIRAAVRWHWCGLVPWKEEAKLARGARTGQSRSCATRGTPRILAFRLFLHFPYVPLAAGLFALVACCCIFLPPGGILSTSCRRVHLAQRHFAVGKIGNDPSLSSLLDSSSLAYVESQFCLFRHSNPLLIGRRQDEQHRLAEYGQPVLLFSSTSSLYGHKRHHSTYDLSFTSYDMSRRPLVR